MKIQILIILFLVFISCKNVTKKETEQVKIIVDSTELKIKTSKKKSGNLKLNSFLESPINLQEFKKKKKRNVTTSVANGMNYYFNPKFSDSIFYGYNFITKNIRQNGINKIIVFKYGKNKHTYEDEKEVLIELRVLNKDIDLGKANFVGLKKNELEAKFGTDYLTFNNGIVYSNENNIFSIELNNSKVKSFRYIKLNTENIDQDLIRLIVE